MKLINVDGFFLSAEDFSSCSAAQRDEALLGVEASTVLIRSTFFISSFSSGTPQEFSHDSLWVWYGARSTVEDMMAQPRSAKKYAFGLRPSRRVRQIRCFSVFSEAGVRSLISRASLLHGRWLQRFWPRRFADFDLGFCCLVYSWQVYWADMRGRAKKAQNMLPEMTRLMCKALALLGKLVIRSQLETQHASHHGKRYAYYKRYGHDTICMPASWRPSRQKHKNIPMPQASNCVHYINDT